MYADDVKLFSSFDNSGQGHLLQGDLYSFDDCCRVNLMDLNLRKCKFMRFFRSRPIDLRYSIRGSLLEEVDSFVDIGIVMDRRLNFNGHIDPMYDILNIRLDFFTSDDLKDPDTPMRINLTIDDFDAKGQVANPRAPCVVTTIDPHYTKNATLQRKARKFRMKTDILRLRDITRKKFVIYATQQKYLEKQRESAQQEIVYQHITEFQEFALDALCKMESYAFKDMTDKQKQLLDLQTNKISEELKIVAAEHQRFLMEVQEVYAHFLFLLKLISYFDDIIAPEDIEDNQDYKIPSPDNIVKLEINERNPVGQNIVHDITQFMDNIVRPYLAKRNHLNGDIWIKGYERTRQKIFNYNRRLTQVALLNHLVSVIHDKSVKTFARRIERPLFLVETSFLTTRIDLLMQHSFKILNDFEKRHTKSKLHLKLSAFVPVILKKIETKLFHHKDTTLILTQDKPKTDNYDALLNVEKMQWYLMGLLQDLEKYPPTACKQIEIQVRKRFDMEKDCSRRALVKQNRLHNWMDHYKNHENFRQRKAS
ncbi:uncharacterized protein LOC142237734 [Haematobia irritans]|uniref:uncharacterized protein LOC142237734 n=1 Tax=Haematobia irritans TaxID=7368 RepID=UPI003F50A4F2